ncbi:MAG TPA: hypothetical protein DEF88_16265 [Porphyromonadaceae bacterium]|jgi:hypothetical protein|nr:hypothetical protein [Porphyromonadaceae bacterium]HCM22305.1 hypothetical protein [Porphyromonadaceae bacterium]
MDILNLKLSYLTNHAHSEFMTEICDLTTASDPVTLKLEAGFADLTKWHDDERIALEKISKSLFAKERDEKDHDRDELFSGMVRSNWSAVRHFDPEVRAAGERIKVVLDHYGNLAPLPVKDQTSKTTELIEELRTNRADDLVKTGLTAWVDELEKRNKAVKEVEDRQYDEAAAKTLLKVHEVRHEVDRAYRAMIKRLDALMLIEGETAYAAYARQLNERVTKYRNIIANREGHSDDKSKEKTKA